MAHEESIHTYEYTYTVLFEPDEDGGFVVTCPALPGLVTHGDTLAEARAHATEAIALYLECLAVMSIPEEELHIEASRELIPGRGHPRGKDSPAVVRRPTRFPSAGSRPWFVLAGRRCGGLMPPQESGPRLSDRSDAVIPLLLA